jgi:hypothetical protein
MASTPQIAVRVAVTDADDAMARLRAVGWRVTAIGESDPAEPVVVEACHPVARGIAETRRARAATLAEAIQQVAEKAGV